MPAFLIKADGPDEYHDPTHSTGITSQAHSAITMALIALGFDNIEVLGVDNIEIGIHPRNTAKS
jgi:hypothetical protein